MVAINPYQALPLYSDAIVHQYRGKRRDENPPHIFAIAERAWMSMGEERENQSILITCVDSVYSRPVILNVLQRGVRRRKDREYEEGHSVSRGDRDGYTCATGGRKWECALAFAHRVEFILGDDAHHWSTPERFISTQGRASAHTHELCRFNELDELETWPTWAA